MFTNKTELNFLSLFNPSIQFFEIGYIFEGSFQKKHIDLLERKIRIGFEISNSLSSSMKHS